MVRERERDAERLSERRGALALTRANRSGKRKARAKETESGAGALSCAGERNNAS
jgi:hypothetical protein